ncbi:hypothetical protein GYRE_00967 [Yokenella regensburgei ATCC 49455]|nr:hypothetical protein GYRE_00967 [Yokenella regensburgei ATCC 49455]
MYMAFSKTEVQFHLNFQMDENQHFSRLFNRISSVMFNL